MHAEERVVIDHGMLWRRLDEPGHEAARLLLRDSCWHLTGTAVFAHNQLPCCLDYLVMCNLEWQTISTKVTGWVGSTIDLDTGEEAKAQAAWLSFPDFTLEVLEQLYRRNQEASYHYESAGGEFVTDLEVNAAGFITQYPGLWQVEVGG
jgi:uncharacterized protein